jgi:2-polyprenyl-6-hydroxyphenyl methylase/3-demethylubiquinone-9 3-methyltransferase
MNSISTWLSYCHTWIGIAVAAAAILSAKPRAMPESNMKEGTLPSSADPDELRRFERLAESWWDPAGPFWPLHRLNALRTGYLSVRLADHFGRDADATEPLSGLRVLDVGCGGGILSESMARLGATVTGIDVVERNVAIASGHARLSGLSIDYRTCSVEQLAGEPGFDVVLNMEVVEHVVALESFMAACTAQVAPTGVMVVATLNRTARSWLFAIIGAEYVLGWLPRGTHRWWKFRTPREIGALCEVNGLDVTELTGVRMNPFTRRLSLSTSLAVNYMLIAKQRPAESASPG